MRLIILSFALSLLFFTATAQTQGELSVTVTTSKTGGEYAPRNIISIWVENIEGQFVKTLLAQAEKRISHLNLWQAATKAVGSEYNRVDAISGATNSNHSTKTCTWDDTDYEGTLLADGNYRLRLELTDKNSTGNDATFTFSKEITTETYSPNDESSFSNMTFNWTPSTSAIKDINNKDMLIYPNPSKGVFSINNAVILDVEVRNIEGKLIAKSTERSIDITSQADGLYFVHIRTPDGIITQELLKQ